MVKSEHRQEFTRLFIYFRGFGEYFDMNNKMISAGTSIVPIYDADGKKIIVKEKMKDEI